MIRDKIYIDSREQGRANRFVEFLETTLKERKTGWFKELKPIQNKFKNGESFYEITNLETGDYIYNNVIVEFKSWADFQQSIANSRIQHQTDKLYFHTKYRDKVMLIVCEDFKIFDKWKYNEYLARIGGKINTQVVKNEADAFELILYLFNLNAEHLDRCTRNTARSDKWMETFLYSSGEFSRAEAQKIINSTNFITPYQVLSFFEKDSKEIVDLLNIPRVNLKKVNNFKKKLNGEPIL